MPTYSDSCHVHCRIICLYLQDVNKFIVEADLKLSCKILSFARFKRESGQTKVYSLVGRTKDSQMTHRMWRHNLRLLNTLRVYICSHSFTTHLCNRCFSLCLTIFHFIRGRLSSSFFARYFDTGSSSRYLGLTSGGCWLQILKWEGVYVSPLDLNSCNGLAVSCLSFLAKSRPYVIYWRL